MEIHIKMEIHDVYQHIATDFSNTRHTAWPAVSKFIDTFSDKDINADIGCGNGKNMLYRKISFKGIDICDEFVKICREKKLDVKIGNVLDIPFDTTTFDNVICIAVIHHLKNNDDRIKAIKELYRICKTGGKIMIYVWAFEQPSDSKRQFTTQDELVPYKKINGEVFYRYYHLYKQNELENDIKLSGINFANIESNYEKGNWYVIITK